MMIYQIIGPNNKLYIGQTQQPLRKRWNDHKKSIKKPLKYYLYNAMRKHGIDAFRIEPVVELTTKEDLDFYENELINRLNTRNPEFGYNQAPGGRGGDKPECQTPEAKKKKLETYKKNYVFERHPRYQPIDVELLKKEYESGKTVKQISLETGLNDTLVWRRLRALGVIRSVEQRNKQIAETMVNVRKNRFWSTRKESA